MKMTKWTEAFLASTKGRIVSLLRGMGRTVNDLANALKLTDNAVRAQLTALERDGLVQKSGVRRGLRKPHQEYQLTPEAEQLFPKAYAPVLTELLTALKGRLQIETVEEILRDAGRQIARSRSFPLREGQMEQRVHEAAVLLCQLGGLAKVERSNGSFMISSASCPLAAVTAIHPELCQSGAALVGEVVGAPVKERCVRGELPRCLFDIEAARR
jgi:predicted ArsR family transcriptional regulator